jgi:hypothetical protein
MDLADSAERRMSSKSSPVFDSMPLDRGLLDLNVMVRRALVQAAPHLDWSSEVAVDKVLQEISCALCSGTGLKRSSASLFNGCDACLKPKMKVSVVRTVEREVGLSPHLSLTRFLERVPEATVSEAQRVSLLEVPQNAYHVVEEEWVAIREDGTYGHGMSPMDAFLNLEVQCDDRDSILAMLARQVAHSISDHIRVKVMRLVSDELSAKSPRAYQGRMIAASD